MISYKSEREIELISKACKIVSKVLKELEKRLKPGITTKYIEETASALIQESGAEPAFFGYKGFPARICTSINEEIVHGIPGLRKLKKGDLISVDIGTKLDGYFGDAAKTFGIGKISKEAQRLIEITRNALYLGIKKAETGNRLSDISNAIQEFVEANGFNVIREFVGHGIGSSMHEDPQIPNFGKPGLGPALKPGMVLAIEPMVSAGDWQVKILDNGWTAITKDNSLAAHFEHTICVTDSGPLILTE